LRCSEHGDFSNAKLTGKRFLRVRGEPLLADANGNPARGAKRHFQWFCLKPEN
jgi:hypothetical protein